MLSIAKSRLQRKHLSGEPRSPAARFRFYDGLMRRNKSVVGRGGEPSRLDFGAAAARLIEANAAAVRPSGITSSLASESGGGIREFTLAGSSLSGPAHRPMKAGIRYEQRGH